MCPARGLRAGLLILLAGVGLTHVGAAWAQNVSGYGGGNIGPGEAEAPANGAVSNPQGQLYEGALGRQHLPPQAGASAPLSTRTPLSPAGVSFLKRSAAQVLFSLQAAELAARRSPQGAGGDALREVGSNAAVLSGLKDLARRHAVSLPSRPDARGEQRLARLQRLTGSAFDRAYRAALRESEHQTLAQFSGAAESSQQTGEIRAFARGELPQLRERVAREDSGASAR